MIYKIIINSVGAWRAMPANAALVDISR